MVFKKKRSVEKATRELKYSLGMNGNQAGDEDGRRSGCKYDCVVIAIDIVMGYWLRSIYVFIYPSVYVYDLVNKYLNISLILVFVEEE